MNVMSILPNITPGPADAFKSTLVNVTPTSSNIPSDLINTFGSTFLIHQPTITLRSAQIGLTPPVYLPQQFFNAYTNLYP